MSEPLPRIVRPDALVAILREVMADLPSGRDPAIPRRLNAMIEVVRDPGLLSPHRLQAPVNPRHAQAMQDLLALDVHIHGTIRQAVTP